MEKNDNKIYDEKNIKTLDTIESIRMRPSMYIGTLYEFGLYKIDSEPFQNAADEFFSKDGTGTKVDITYDIENNIMEFKDDGRGIPIGVLEDIFTKLHTGGKFDHNAYSRSSGFNGVGLKAVNALSNWLECEVYRKSYYENGKKIPAKYAKIRFNKGKKEFLEIKDLPNIPEEKEISGTTIRYQTDTSIMKTDKRDINKFKEYLNISSYINPGFKITYTVVGQKPIVYYHTGGIKEYLTEIMKNRKIKPLTDLIEFNGKTDLSDFNIIFSYTTSQSGDSNIFSFVNGNRTALHGFHVTAFKNGASAALTQYITQTDAIPKSLKNLKITGSLISDNLIAVVELQHDEPLYDGQTKESFKSLDIVEPIKELTKNTFLKWLHDNPNQAKKLIDMAIDYAKYEEERKKLKKNMLQTKQVKNAFSANGIDPSKFISCRSNNPEEKELIIVEGKSAAGSVSKSMDRGYQAVYKLTGKTLNVVKNPKDFSKVILDIIQILGCGMPNNKNIKNLQYYKIIIMTDADDDGAHITTLLLGFFFTFYPELITNGHIFVAKPPLKSISTGKHKFYIRSDAQFDLLMREYIVETFDLYSEKTDLKLSTGLFRVFIDACRGYDTLLQNHASSLSIDPNLLEIIVIYINDLFKGNYKEFEKRGYTVKCNGNKFSFDLGFNHSFLEINESFLKYSYNEIFDKLKEIHIYGIYLKGKKSGFDYKGTIYYLMNIMNCILGNKIEIKRYKGLGECDAEDLFETSINPDTRMITKITMEDYPKAKRMIDIFMGTAEPETKALFYAGEIDLD